MKNLLNSIMLQTTFRQQLNTLLSDYGLPLFLFIVIVGVIVGLTRNFSKINSDNWGDKKEGLINLLITVAYVFLIVAVITISIATISSLDLTI